MQVLDIEEIILRIGQESTFEAKTEGFTIKIDEYVPYVCTAIHSGHSLNEKLKRNILISPAEVWKNEEPHTGEFVSSLPIVIIANDSKFEYDLNLPIEENKKLWSNDSVWKKSLTKQITEKNQQKYNDFYRVIVKLVEKLEQKFKSCLIYNIHSYNHRQEKVGSNPVFNVNSKSIDKERYGKTLSNWKEQLKKINLPNLETTVGENQKTSCDGFFAHYIQHKFKNTCILTTNIKKVYCDENSGVIFPIVIEALVENLKEAILDNAIVFAQNQTNLKVRKKQKLLSIGLNETLLKVDMQLYKLVHDFELLSLVNPINLEEEKKKFFASKYVNTQPEFKYKQVAINPFDFKRKLYQIPVDEIKDIDIQHLYKDVINSYADKIDMINCIGTKDFLYTSLRYFGEPNEEDIANSHYLLHIPKFVKKEDEKKVTTEYVEKIMRSTIDEYGFNCDIEVTDNITAAAMVLNNEKKLLLKKSGRFSAYDVKILANHEVGVHMVTTINARTQPLRIFQLGLPLNTLTQEGLAVLSEFLSGSLNTIRLRELGLRCLAIRYMLKGNDFRKTFLYLVEEHKLDFNTAFYLTVRVFRGGGFTKDHLYLRGFRDMLKFYKEGKNLSPLLIGKTSLKYLPIIKEMIERKLAYAPRYKTIHFENPVENNPILEYAVNGIK
jgi:uncharacterized protein (TIGR02421 family)